MSFLGSFGRANGFSFGDEQLDKDKGKNDKGKNQRGPASPSGAKTALIYVLGSTAFAITILVKFAETAG